MQENMYWVCADAISLATQLGTAHDLPAPEVLRQRIGSLFQQMREKGRAAGISVEDTNEAMYALAAFMDEQILRSPWPGRQQWMAQPLQLAFFQENTAGHGFFVRMQGIGSVPGREHVLQIYALCIALGFQGQYALSSTGELVDIQDRSLSAASRGLPAIEAFSPDGYPKRGFGALRDRRMPVLVTGLGVFAACILLFLVLRVVLSVNVSNAEEEIGAGARLDSDTGADLRIRRGVSTC